MLHNRNLRIEPADSWHQPGSIENQYYTKDWQKSDKKQLSEQSNEDFVESDIKNTIQMLNDDCLMHIFLQLSIIERIRMEMGKDVRLFFYYKIIYCLQNMYVNKELIQYVNF